MPPVQKPPALSPSSLRLAEAVRAQEAGDAARALELAREVLKREPRNARALYVAGTSELTLGASTDASKTLAKAARIAPRAIPILHNLSKALSQSGRLAEAHAPLDRALAIRPDEGHCIGAKIDLLITEGRYEEAERTASRALASDAPPHPTLVLAFARLAPRIDRADEAIEMLRAAVREPSLTRGNRILLHFQLGSLLDRSGRYDEAFEAFREGNALYALRFDPAGHEAAIDRVVRAWTRDAVAGAPAAPLRDERPVFIVGMPRSGTSLVEQILASHPRVVALGERPDVKRFVHEQAPAPADRPAMIESPSVLHRPALDRFARAYTRAFRRAGAAERYTDKMPDNFLHLGVISLAFPRARIIVCRRDPLDTCLSCYFQHFGGVYPYVYDMEALARFHRTSERLLEHWKSVLDLPVLEVEYERLVGDQAGESRRMVEFCGLAWDDACLRFHESRRVVNTASNEQVRRPIYASSVGRHRHYERHLEPLRRALCRQNAT